LNIASVKNETKKITVDCELGSFYIEYWPNRLTTRFMKNFVEAADVSENVTFLIENLVSDWELTTNYPIVESFSADNIKNPDDVAYVVFEDKLQILPVDACVLKYTTLNGDAIPQVKTLKIPRTKLACDDLPLEISGAISKAILDELNEKKQKPSQ